MPTINTPTLPRWRSHKVVQAAKIISMAPASEPGAALLILEGPGNPIATVDYEWLHKRVPGVANGPNPQFTAAIGGYFVVYEDGYTSWSPAKAFEEGHTRIEG